MISGQALIIVKDNFWVSDGQELDAIWIYVGYVRRSTAHLRSTHGYKLDKFWIDSSGQKTDTNWTNLGQSLHKC